MRVIAGTAKGLRLTAPRGTQVRPTTDAMRETLFNILADCVAGARFLDLFAGCGSVGIEALSRGAEWCTLVEISPQCVRAIRENLEHTRLAERGEVRRGDARRVLRRISEGEPYDVAFVDPPYGYARLGEVVTALVIHRRGLREGGVIVVQHEQGASLPDAPAPSRVKRFGATSMSFYW